MYKKLLLGTILFVSSISASTINIAVAANVSYAIDDLKKEFNKIYPNTKVNVTLGSSGKLTAQIKHGAPYDLFMSANMKYPNSLYKDKVALTKPIIYTQGGLALLSNNQRSFKHGIKLLKSKLVKRVAIANPKTAPYGKATMEAFKKSDIYDEIKDKIIYGESISQTVSYAIMAADIGIIAKSSLYSPKMKKFIKNVHWIDVDPKLYTPINQGVVILKYSKNSSETKAFYEFILSNKAKEIFKKYGYLIP
ncbi:MAG: molybdate ABC transporter substrate-binding protein [Campylobacterota bacterium]|nr:molybdate ABC transporter substrate-binding protein [Campylobacterota bacterium]